MLVSHGAAKKAFVSSQEEEEDDDSYKPSYSSQVVNTLKKPFVLRDDDPWQTLK